MKKIWIAGALALMLGASTLATLPAQASTSGRRNTAIGLGAAAIYELANGNTVAGLALGAGAAYGYKRYQDEKRYEDRYGYYGGRYGGRYYRDDRATYRDDYRRWDDRGHEYRYDRARYDRHDRR
jgi:hypothetical protein